MGECPGAGMTEKLQRIKADPGTKITFNWDQSPDSLPTVIHMSSCSGSWDDFDCNFSGGKDLGKTTVGERNSISFTVPEDTKPGSFFCFADSYGDHCKKGIHSTVKIGSEKHGDDGQMASRGNSEAEAPFESLDELMGYCKNVDQATCKMCNAKFKKGKCAVKARKLKKIHCRKMKDADFCAKMSCTFNKKRNTCGGKTFLQK